MTKLERFERSPDLEDQGVDRKTKRQEIINGILEGELNLVDAKDFLNAVEYLQGDDTDGVLGRQLINQISQAANHEDRSQRIAKAIEEFKVHWHNLHPDSKKEEESTDLPKAA